MTERWKESRRIPITVVGSHERLVLCEGIHGWTEAVVYQRVSCEVDITEECTAELHKSRHSDGFYVRILHRGKNIAVLGVDDASRMQVNTGYAVRKAEGATVSFRIRKTR